MAANDLALQGAKTSAAMILMILTWFFRNTGLILGLRPANERRRYFVTMSLIGRAET